MIRTLEELSMNAWPALQTLHYAGWVLRFADGYTKRANSIHPLYDTDIDLDERLAVCERLYRGLNLPTVFKMTPAPAPSDLDMRLAEHGYRAESDTSVQLLDLSKSAYTTIQGVDLTSTDDPAWHAAHVRMGHIDENRREFHERIVRSILPDKCYASIRTDGEIIACGLGVTQADYLGLFDIIIDPAHRRQGHGERLMLALLNWGIQQRAHAAYLQVTCDNEPALKLYEKLGFAEAYRYWYRIKA